MIYGVSHLQRTVPEGGLADFMVAFGATESQTVKSNPRKRPFLLSEGPDTQDVAFGDDGMPFELIEYPKVGYGYGTYYDRAPWDIAYEVAGPVGPSCAFWSTLGAERGDGDAMRWTFPTGVSLSVEPERRPHAPVWWALNGSFSPCLALLTNAIDEDRARALRYATRASPPFSVPEMKCRVCILAGPNSELVELVEGRR